MVLSVTVVCSLLSHKLSGDLVCMLLLLLLLLLLFVG